MNGRGSTYTFTTDYGGYYGSPVYNYVPRGMRFSGEELKHILLAMVVLIFAFTIILYRFYSNYLPLDLGIAVVAGFTGFLFHELMHKYFAQKFGAWAEFRSSRFGLLLAFITALLGFLFAAPGAVYISGYLDRRQNGIVSIAGPLTNSSFSILFLLLAVAFSSNFILFESLAYISFLDAWLGVFNMLPIPPLDGYKVLRWNAGSYAAGIILPLAIIGILTVMGVGFL
ncbi:MAG: site-2 protease family protein [Thermoplasmata archaeon]|uniref:Site-2 protease family protein n=1 Tax=Candidatus Sysuiplasma superficiale TaxID=2823368 RepID=A0A8J7YTX9_9ARCH|nr:site-2 protease family protein [Candidatus Sysuiplasma superficiale]MBX8644609.1 site-2 protease family protein [Candidatus Sysuiplasma superficiale]MCL4347181.1 site-2 protease family protein [Candidatus Thermoplasmatota archaeon]